MLFLALVLDDKMYGTISKENFLIHFQYLYLIILLNEPREKINDKN